MRSSPVMLLRKNRKDRPICPNSFPFPFLFKILWIEVAFVTGWIVPGVCSTIPHAKMLWPTVTAVSSGLSHYSQHKQLSRIKAAVCITIATTPVRAATIGLAVTWLTTIVPTASEAVVPNSNEPSVCPADHHSHRHCFCYSCCIHRH